MGQQWLGLDLLGLRPSCPRQLDQGDLVDRVGLVDLGHHRDQLCLVDRRDRVDLRCLVGLRVLFVLNYQIEFRLLHLALHPVDLE